MRKKRLNLNMSKIDPMSFEELDEDFYGLIDQDYDDYQSPTHGLYNIRQSFEKRYRADE